MNSNFYFMKDIDPELYQKLVIAEKSLYTSKKSTGKALREFWEKFSADIIIKNGIYDDLRQHLGDRNLDLANRLAFLTQPGKNQNRNDKFASHYEFIKNLNRQRELNGQKPIKLFSDSNISAIFSPKYNPQSINRYYDKSKNTNHPISLMYFFRQYCNDCCHEPTDFQKPIFDVNLIQTQDYLARLHKFLRDYFCVKAAEYDERIILFDKFEVTKVNTNPSDSFRSGCCKECTALHYATTGFTKTFPAIICFFKKSDLDENFCSRSASAYSLLGKNSCGMGLRQIFELSDFESDSEFYIIAYVFENEPTVLNNTLLKNTSFDIRLKWCEEIAGIISNLHSNNPRIFHRLINHNCIYISKEKAENSELVPSLLKMSFAKIDDSNAATIFMNAIKAVDKTKLCRPEENKYIAPELRNYTEANNTELLWEKVDVYSLAILISDILCADISTKIHSVAELKAAGVTENIIGIIASCVNSPVESRPTASQILSTLQNR